MDGERESIGLDPKSLARHYRTILRRGEQDVSVLENAGGSASAEPDLSLPAVTDRMKRLRSELTRIVKEELGDDPDLYTLIDQIVAQGETALHLLGAGDDQALADSSGFGDVEVIVQLDGSRPSFMVRGDKADLKSSPVGGWSDRLGAQEESLRDALCCVGRIDDPSQPLGWVGTGFLVHNNLIMTNRHVLQALGKEVEDHSWSLHTNLAIDFGHEFRSVETARRRVLHSVAFCPRDPIVTTAIDHKRLDLVLIELTPSDASNRPPATLAIDIGPEWANPGEVVFVAGYPGKPLFGQYEPSLLDQLFRSTFGYKRLAPGLVTAPVDFAAEATSLTTAHDATTLGGNSGSCVVRFDRPNAAAGLHYGGRRVEPRENWAHILGRTLAAEDSQTGASLRNVLDRFGVNLIDRIGERNDG